MSQQEFREKVLKTLGASPGEVRELIAYDQNRFDHSGVKTRIKIPLPDELFMAAWEIYDQEAKEKELFAVLRNNLVQLRFPIRKGISQTRDYRAATLSGVPPEGIPEATGLKILSPAQLQLDLYQSLAGRIPTIVSTQRKDFVSLVRALAMKNEPVPIPKSMGSVTVAGYNDWSRIRRLREEWETKNPTGDWANEFERIIPRKELYQDRFIILSDGPYSGVPAKDMGVTVKEWRRLSLVIRRHHECTHYFTRRLFSSMKNRLIDELIADYMGIVAAAGRYRADWFLRFVGLEDFPQYRKGGRLENYRGDPPLSDGAFKILQALVQRAAENLDRFDARYGKELRTPRGRAIAITTLTFPTLEELASDRALSILQTGLGKAGILFIRES